jgi:hypothetical protein
MIFSAVEVCPKGALVFSEAPCLASKFEQSSGNSQKFEKLQSDYQKTPNSTLISKQLIKLQKIT